MHYNLRIDTPTLRLRPVCQRDAAATCELMTADVARELVTWPAPMSQAQARERIRQARRDYRRGRGVELAIFDRARLGLMGWLGFRLDANEPGLASLGYWLGSRFQGRGIMSAAVGAALMPAAAELGIRALRADVFTDNVASIRILTRLGMSPCGEGSVFSVGRGATAKKLSFELELGKVRAATTGAREEPSAARPLSL